MCNSQSTEFVILSIADYNPALQSRNVKLIKKLNAPNPFFAVLQPMMAAQCQNEVVVLPCDELFYDFSKQPFTCIMPAGKTFCELTQNDVLSATLF